MFDRILNPSSEVFDGITGDYIGRAHFSLTSEAEKNMLDYLNYGIVPKSLILFDVDIGETSKNYAVPELFQKNRRVAAFHAAARDEDSGMYLPFVIHVTYDTIVRGNLCKSTCHVDSAEVSSIEPIATNWIRK